ncbi:unnamed protein product [Protopolystoma xenopodis]|uniref:UDP-glucose:glycoprotein glucosyltransferase thioredoxin-like domain-containing protein n=1 Tax=Protopolystoma xenopodis TaxID=117903 RepID=A0A448WBU1_9PLAT|nr:unnamed protein product [Protopolystoma xenopodis]
MDIDAFEEALKKLRLEDFVPLHSAFSTRVLGLKPGQRALVINGRILGPLGPEESFSTGDFRLAEQITLSGGARSISVLLSRLSKSETGASGHPELSELTYRVHALLKANEETSSDLVTSNGMITYEGISLGENNQRMYFTDLPNHLTGRLQWKPRRAIDQPVFQIMALIDPASQSAQRLSHVLLTLYEALPCSVQIVLNPFGFA